MNLLYVPLSLNAVVGLPRKGKTALSVLMAIQAHDRGSLVYSNFFINDGKGNDIRAPDGRLDPEDPKECLHQLEDIFVEIKENETWDTERFLILDEFSSLADSQNWKSFSWTTDIWKQLGKLGFTAVALDQNFSRIYNGYRDLVTYKYLVGDMDVNGDYVTLPYCSVVIGRQSSNDHTMYMRVADCYINLSPVFDRYNTHQLMYFGSKSKNKKG